MNRKVFLVILVLVLEIFVIGCGNKKQTETSKNSTKTEEVKTVTSQLINCQECVFAYYTHSRTINSKLTEYVDDYTKLKDDKGNQREAFLGFIIDEDKNIQKAFVCGIEDQTAYCLESSATEDTYENNKQILNQVYNPNDCRETKNESYICKRNSEANISASRSIRIEKNSVCLSIDKRGIMYCEQK